MMDSPLIRPAACSCAVLLTLAGCSDRRLPAQPSPAGSAAAGPLDAASSSTPALTARASFDIEPEGSCRRTRATIEVTEHTADHGPATVKIAYSLLGTCGGQQGLYYYDFATDGAVSVDPASVAIDASLQRARVDAVVPVFEAEAGIYSQVRVQATWERAGGGGSTATSARLDVFAPWISPLYVTSPVSPALQAELTRSVE